jgi:hypothetical protein
MLRCCTSIDTNFSRKSFFFYNTHFHSSLSLSLSLSLFDKYLKVRYFNSSIAWNSVSFFTCCTIESLWSTNCNSFVLKPIQQTFFSYQQILSFIHSFTHSLTHSLSLSFSPLINLPFFNKFHVSFAFSTFRLNF